MGRPVFVVDLDGRGVGVGRGRHGRVRGPIPGRAHGVEVIAVGIITGGFARGIGVKVGDHGHTGSGLGRAGERIELDVRDGTGDRRAAQARPGRSGVVDLVLIHLPTLDDQTARRGQVAVGIEAEIAGPGIVGGGIAGVEQAPVGTDLTLLLAHEKAVAADGHVRAGRGGLQTALGIVGGDTAHADAAAHLIRARGRTDGGTHQVHEIDPRGLESRGVDVGQIVTNGGHLGRIREQARNARPHGCAQSDSHNITSLRHGLAFLRHTLS